MDALDARHLLLILEGEREIAREHGLYADADYAHDLEQDIATCLQLYVRAAVTEIATLHGLLFGRHQG